MKITKKVVSLSLVLLLALSSIPSAFACTGIYVGKDKSQNGSTYVGRSEDIGDMYDKMFGVEPAKDWAEGAMYEDAYGFKMPYPKHTYAYTYVKDTPEQEETVMGPNGECLSIAYGAAGQNEKGLSVTSTVSTKYNEEAKKADPLVEGAGICEISIPSVLLGGAATAKEAVKLLANVIDTYGAGECNSLMISDIHESWYMEIVSGHQYAAVKLPTDKVSVQPNIMLLGVIDVKDTENVIVSENLVKLAQDNGFLKTDEKGNIDVAKTYAVRDSGKGQYSRYYQGMFYVNEEEANKLDVTNVNNGVNPLPLFIDPTKQMSTLDVLQWLAYRGQGSKMDSNKDESIYAIGNNRQAECHVFEIRQNMPEKLATLQWQAMADAEFSVYVPFYTAMITDTLENYRNPSKDPVDNSINWNFQVINNLCYANRETCAKSVKAYFEEYQKSLIEQQKAIDVEMAKLYAKDPAQAAQKATELGMDLAKQILKMSNSVVTELKAYLKGDQAEPFVPTAMTNKVMPVYSFDHVTEDKTGWQHNDYGWWYNDFNETYVTGWQQIDGYWYYFAEDGYMQTGWQQINGYWYYLGTSGDMQTGWQWIDGSCYYFYPGGWMAADTWVDGYYVNGSGVWVK